MRRTVIMLTTLFTIISCNQKSNGIVKTELDENRLLQFYKDTTFSEFYVYPDTAASQHSKYLFKGKMMDSLTCAELPKSITENLPWTEGFYGIYSFEFDKNHTGLITRVPGAYSSSTISLWIYDNQSKKIIQDLKLADLFGDAGASDIYNSWLFSEKSKGLRVLMYDYNSYDHAVEDVNDTIVEVTEEYYLLNVKADVTDTLSKNPEELKKRFAKQLDKMSL